MVNGPKGKALIIALSESSLKVQFEWGTDRPKPLPCSILVGLPRPQTARKILKECTSLGIKEIHFFQAEKSVPSYRNSKLWQTGEWRRLIREGAEQAFSTFRPGIFHYNSLKDAIGATALSENINKVSLDIYEFTDSISDLKMIPGDWLLAIGPEGGWTQVERQVLKFNDFRFCRMGSQILRTETAAIAAISSLATTQKWW